MSDINKEEKEKVEDVVENTVEEANVTASEVDVTADDSNSDDDNSKVVLKTKTDRNVGSPRKFSGKRNKGADAGQVESPEFIEKVVSIKRITKVTKGGKKLSFSALVVVGDAKGKVGYGLAKASEVAIAIRKSIIVAKRSFIFVPLKGSTIAHEIIGQCSGSRVLLKPASEGTGVIASGSVRAVCDGAGIHNILTKCHRSNNPINVVKATFDGLSRLKAIVKPEVNDAVTVDAAAVSVN